MDTRDPETNSEFTPKKRDAWNIYDILSYWVKRPIFRCELAVSFTESSGWLSG